MEREGEYSTRLARICSAVGSPRISLFVCKCTENHRLVVTLTAPAESATAQWWYENDLVFQAVLNGIFTRLDIAPGALGARLHAWGARNFATDYQDAFYARALTSFRKFLLAMGGLNAAGRLVTPGNTPNNSPSNSPSRGGGGNAGGSVQAAP
jgi:hypothetical protein